MTIPNTARKAGPLLGTGSQTAWPFTFKVFAAGDVQVTIANSAGTETLLVLGTDYSVTLNSNQETSPGGTVNYPISGAALPVGSVLAIIGDLDYDQPLDLPSGGNFSPLALENQLDRATMQIQQLKEEVDRSAKLPPTSAESVEALVDDLQRIADSADNLDTVADNIADITAVANDLNEPVSEINTVAGAIANVNAVGSNITNVNTVAGISANVTTVAGIAANVTAVAAIDDDVTAVAGVAAAVTAVAAIDDDVTIAAANVADITNFADVYQGPKASDPALRNDGSALQVGDLYFNTTNDEMRVYGGTLWKSGFVGTVAVQNFSGNGSTTAFTLTTAPGGENNTQIFIGGVYQQKDQYSVSGTTLTFSTAPTTGTNNIEVVTISTLALGETDASLVSFVQAGTGAVERTAQGKMRETVSVKDFGAVGDGVADDTSAIQTGVNACVVAGQVLFMPAGTYKVTDTINIPSFTQIVGEHKNMNAKGYGVEPRGTKISFEPTSAKSLFVASGTPPFGTFRSSYSIENLYIVGNSTNSSGNSIYAIDVDSIVASTFQNLAIQHFRTGIRCDATINNRFEFVRVINCYVQCILYDGGTATTDVWEQCYISNAPIGVQTNGVCLGIRFNNCIFETLDNYGVNLIKEVFGWSFVNCYAEDVPATNNANGAMFRVGYDGTTLAAGQQLSVIGGLYGGRNAGAVGAMLDVDFTDGVTLGGFQVSRYTNVVKTSANTQTNQVVATGWVSSSVTTQVSDLTKMVGMWGTGVINGSARNAQRANIYVLYANDIRSNIGMTGNINFGCASVTLGSTGGYVAPNADNSLSNGLSNLRWSVIYAATGTINTSDARSKQQVRDLSGAERAVAIRCKALLKAFKFNDAVESKGDKARIHFGVLAQDVDTAFAAEGLNAADYALFCYDEWEAQPEEWDEDGHLIRKAQDAGNRYGVRYEELLAFIISAL